MLVADMFTEPNAEKRFTLAEVTARATRKGLRFSGDQISEVRGAAQEEESLMGVALSDFSASVSNSSSAAKAA
jgi:hypothetical protein